MTTSTSSTSSLPTLAVTGVTGAVGRMVAQHLADANQPQRLLARTPDRAPVLPASPIYPFSYNNHAASVTALTGVSTLFMVSAAEDERRVDQHRAFIDAAVEAGVEHIVYTSFFGAAPDSTFTLARDHYATEQYVRASGISWTFLRDNLYADFMGALAGEDGVIRGPAGDGSVSVVARADVAAVAAAVLLDPAAHHNQTYNLTGPEALTLTEVAAILSEARGTPITFYNESLDEAHKSRAKWAAPDWQVDAWVSTYTAIASGELSEVSGDIERVTGRAATSLAELLEASRVGLPLL